MTRRKRTKNYLSGIRLECEDSEIVLTKDKYPIQSSVEDLQINCSNMKLGYHWIPDTLLSISFSKFDQELTRNIIGNTLKTIDFGDRFNQSLSDSNGIPWLPRTLESIRFGESFQQSINRDELPPSLTSLTLDENYKGIIVNGSIPNSIKDLNYQFHSNNSIKLIPNSTVRDENSKSIPGGTTSLEFDYNFNQTIKKGMIPHNVTSLEFSGSNGTYLDSTLINPFSGFKHLTSLGCSTIEDNLPDSILPNSLTTLILDCQYLQLTNNLLPRNLKVLELSYFSQSINVGNLPSSIEILKLPSFSQPIQKDVLPQSLTSLHLGIDFNLTIDRDALPPNLKSFYFSSSQLVFKKLPDLIWPSSFESLYIPNDS
ncbi:hypothetical protein DDB_G0268612 [Dictyostelium discoideum AX4]|uniref:FNIP repeat-containing protein n=1 Tax=Dictyostelium discoideum TaxID=44689 RepID=Q55F50_DICDI|nr:hypothetical protein DDB_G0268612 [Dictyostelium discoideum AX4]EAL73759.1 hypothetical protein DDB_G0268612 [Dictyostelium discoideum AX4]|eukprot:XP_647683.1 hypothetical protein DDB_G0268612 [Dictyostelium discoideum AX4]